MPGKQTPFRRNEVCFLIGDLRKWILRNSRIAIDNCQCGTEMSRPIRISEYPIKLTNCASARRFRSGFTLVEALVVIGIIGTLVTLAIPAVQIARAAAGRTRCADNLRQVALALHRYHEAFNAFPAGVDYRSGNSPYQSWHAKLLPYIDQQLLWQQTQQAFQEEKNLTVNPPHIGLNTAIPLYACPIDDRTLYPQETPLHIEVALTSYLGIAGIDFLSNSTVSI